MRGGCRTRSSSLPTADTSNVHRSAACRRPGQAACKDELVYVGRAGRKQLDGIDIAGKVALVDWEVERLWPYHVGLELGLRGAAAMVVTSPPGGPYYQAPDALGTFDGLWHAEAPPCVTIRKEDAAELRQHEGAMVKVVLTGAAHPGCRSSECRRHPARPPRWRTVDRRWSPRRLVRRSVRRCERGRGDAGARARVRREGNQARTADRVRLAHCRGVRHRAIRRTTGATAPGIRSSKSTASGPPVRPSTSTSRAPAGPRRSSWTLRRN